MASSKQVHQRRQGNFSNTGVRGSNKSGTRGGGHTANGVVGGFGRRGSSSPQQPCQFQSLSPDVGLGNTDYNLFIYQQQQQDEFPLDPYDACSNAWLLAVDQATAGLRTYKTPASAAMTTRSPTSWTTITPRTARPTIGELEFSIAYLSHLERLLYQNPMSLWKFPPKSNPPEYHTFEPSSPAPETKNLSQGQMDALWPSVSPIKSSGAKKRSKISPPRVPGKNRYAIIASIDSDDEDDDEDLEEAGDRPLLHFNFWSVPRNVGGSRGMDVRRLIIRTCCAQSDLWNFMAMERVRAKEWTLGAKAYHQSGQKTRQALELADTEISKWWFKREQDLYRPHKPAFQDTQKFQDLVQDADVVGVAIQQLCQQRDKYIAAAERHRDSLLRKLTPLWKSREEMKKRWGNERWKNNPNARHDLAKLRIAQEQELMHVQEALELVLEETSEFSATMAEMEETTQKWQTQLFHLQQQALNSSPEVSFLPSFGHQGDSSFLDNSMSQTTTSTSSSTTCSASPLSSSPTMFGI